MLNLALLVSSVPKREYVRGVEVISKCATAAQLHGHPRPHMQCGCVLIDRCRRLGTAVPIQVVEIQGIDAMFAESAFEGGAAIHRFGCVISHIFNCSPYICLTLGQEVCNLRGHQIPSSGSDSVFL